VAKFSVTLSMTWPPHTGTFEGCLDDMHRDPAQQPYVPVPRIWGELKLN
jgi:hypothetical protein